MHLACTIVRTTGLWGLVANPWTDGPRELIQHAVDHLALGGDFDRRIAMISVDNAVELTIKTYLGLPERARGDKGLAGGSWTRQASHSPPYLTFSRLTPQRRSLA